MVPIFIITYNQSTLVERTISSYRRLSTAVDIIVHDNGSDSPEMIDVLGKLEVEGVKVYRNPKLETVDDLNTVNSTIDKYFEAAGGRCNYVVTDPDIDLTFAHPQTLEVYKELLDVFPGAECVGPMLRIDDIPNSYPLRSAATDRHIEQFWQHRPRWAAISWGRVAYQEAKIDTTFALHRAGEKFRRLKKGIRVYHPFEAHHLDWYIKEDDATPGRVDISHWSRRVLIDRHKNRAFREREFYRVEEVEGTLRTMIYRADAQGCTPVRVCEDG